MKLRKHKPNMQEVHQYTLDLERITMLRDKSKRDGEIANYNTVIECMLLVLQRLNEV